MFHVWVSMNCIFVIKLTIQYITFLSETKLIFFSVKNSREITVLYFIVNNT